MRKAIALLAGLAVLGTSCRGLIRTIGSALDAERHGEAQPRVALIARATTERLVPTLASVLGSAAVLLPAAAAFSATGFDILRPAAIAFIGGMLTTTVITLFVVPSIQLWIGSGPDMDQWVTRLTFKQAD